MNRVTSGLIKVAKCPICGIRPRMPNGEDIEATLDPSLGSQWPDVLGCGSYPFFIVSSRVVDSWRQEGIGEFPYHRVTILGSLPKLLTDKDQPAYCWIDGAKMKGALLDYSASGFVGHANATAGADTINFQAGLTGTITLSFCTKCGYPRYDVSATYDRRHLGKYPYALIRDSWNGAKLFTTDLSPTLFFCTDEVLRSAQRHRLTNFRFVAVEEGGSPASAGIDYLKDLPNTNMTH